MKYSIFGVTAALTVFLVVLTSLAVGYGIYLVDKDDPLRWQAMLVSGVSILVAVFLSFLFSRHLLAPMRQIMSALRAFGGGQQEVLLPVRRRDELGAMARGIDHMMQEIQARGAESEASRAKLEALFRVVQEGIVITDQAGIIESVNPSLCRMFGYEEQELLGQSNLILMPEPYASHHDKYMRDSMRTGTLGFMGMYRDLTALRKDGTIFPVVINVETLFLGDKTLFAAIIRDITREKEYERDLLNAKMRAEVANEAKSNFLSMMSHEIRTPLNGIMGVLQILEAEHSGPEQRQYLDVASRSAANLLHIVNDILDISKAEAGNMELEIQEFRLQDLVEESIELYLPQLMDTDIIMRYYMSMDMPEYLLGDPFRLQQLINNLLSNAIKFTRRGEIGLNVSWEPRGEHDINIRIDVSDTGVGISPEKLKTIFEPFVQADPAISRSYGGTGLGLSIVKRIATLMGGRVWVDSTPGEGSTFHLFLNLQASGRPSENTNGWLAGRQVLYIGEHRSKSMLLEYLRHRQAVVEEASLQEVEDGGLSHNNNYGIVVLECSDKTATETVNRLAEQSTAEGVRFICLGNRPGAQACELCRGAFSLNEPLLSKSLDGLFSLLEHQPDHMKRPVHQDDKGENMPRILLVEDNPVNQMVAKSMLTRIGYDILIANNGQEAVDSVRSEDVDLVLMDCHMPVMDGFEATRQIRDYLGGRQLPIVAMTADAGISDRERCIAAGMDDHIPKPIKIDILQSTIESWLAA